MIGLKFYTLSPTLGQFPVKAKKKSLILLYEKVKKC